MARGAAEVSAGRVMSGRYRLGEEIGRGGMAKVFAAVDQDLDRPVALKVLQPSLASSETIRRRFLREARAAAKLTSDHVVRVFDVGSLEDGQLWIVMERLEGLDLRQRMAAGPLSQEEAVDAVLQACVALAEAHAAGLVHRDLKPSNLFVASAPDGISRVKVLDFGIAKATPRDQDAGLTSTSELLGSPRYMSPEQLRGAAGVDARSDVWALGVILYELLEHRPPFPGRSVAELHAAILEHPPAPSNDGLPAVLRHAVLRCLDKDPDRRFGDVVALAETLAPFGSERAAGYVRTARGYAQRADDLGRITEPELDRSEPIESVVETSGPEVSAPGAVPGDDEARDRGDEVLEPAPIGLETDATWNASASPSHRGRTGWVVFGAMVVLTSVLFLVVTGDEPDSEPALGAQATGAAALPPSSPEPSTDTGSTEPTTTAIAPSASATVDPVASSSAASPPDPPLRAPRRRAPDPVPSLYDDRE